MQSVVTGYASANFAKKTLRRAICNAVFNPYCPRRRDLLEDYSGKDK